MAQGVKLANICTAKFSWVFFSFKECVKQESQDIKANELNYQIEIHSFYLFCRIKWKDKSSLFRILQVLDFWRNVSHNISQEKMKNTLEYLEIS